MLKRVPVKTISDSRGSQVTRTPVLRPSHGGRRAGQVGGADDEAERIEVGERQPAAQHQQRDDHRRLAAAREGHGGMLHRTARGLHGGSITRFKPNGSTTQIICCCSARGVAISATDHRRPRGDSGVSRKCHSARPLGTSLASVQGVASASSTYQPRRPEQGALHQLQNRSMMAFAAPWPPGGQAATSPGTAICCCVRPT